MRSTNGNNGVAPIGRRKVSARGLLHKHCTKTQLAATLAGVLEGDVGYTPTARELAQTFGVSEAYIRIARAMSPEKRQAVAAGTDRTSIAGLLNPPVPILALPAPQSPISDVELVAIARKVGAERMLDAAAMAEAAQ